VVPVVPVRHDPPPMSRATRYRVRRGDTISSIAHRHGCTNLREIERMNGIRHFRIRVGQVIRLPACRR
jgi:membrane-bound lytic murein transglycosylase D